MRQLVDAWTDMQDTSMRIVKKHIPSEEDDDMQLLQWSLTCKSELNMA